MFPRRVGRDPFALAMGGLALARRWLGRLMGPLQRPGHHLSPLVGPADAARRGDPAAPVAGVDLDPGRLWANLADVASSVTGLMLPRRPSGDHSYYADNAVYGAGDAAVLTGMLRRFRPRRIVEVGSGFTTAVILDALGDGPLELTTIDPDPSRLDELGIRQHPRLTVRVGLLQEGPLSLFDALEAGDFLVLDTSHVGKTGSDVLWYLFEVLPRLAPGVLVHVHDVFSGFEYPAAWLRAGNSWNEAYLLRAFLSFNPRFEVFLWPNRCRILDRDRAVALIPQLAENSGGQIWLRVRA